MTLAIDAAMAVLIWLVQLIIDRLISMYVEFLCNNGKPGTVGVAITFPECHAPPRLPRLDL